MSEHKANERRDARLREEAKDRAQAIAILATIRSIGAGAPDIGIAHERVREARLILAASYASEGLPSPFPAASPSVGAAPETQEKK